MIPTHYAKFTDFAQDRILNYFRSHNIDLEALKTFLVVAKFESISAAADLLCKSPSVISRRIFSLEEKFNTRLFKRSTRKISLLPVGEHLRDRVLQMYEILNQIFDELHQLNLGVEPKFVMIINNLLCNPDAVAELLDNLYQLFPKTKFIIYQDVYMGVWDRMLSQHANFGIGLPGWHPIDECYETLPIGKVIWRFVLSPNHPLIQEKEPLSNEILARYPAINVEDTSQKLSKRIAWILPGQDEILVPNMHTKIACHLRGLGIGFIPSVLSAPYLKNHQLVTREVCSGRAESPVSIGWGKNSKGKIVEYMCTLFKEKNSVILPFLKGIAPIQ